MGGYTAGKGWGEGVTLLSFPRWYWNCLLFACVVSPMLHTANVDFLSDILCSTHLCRALRGIVGRCLQMMRRVGRGGVQSSGLEGGGLRGELCGAGVDEARSYPPLPPPHRSVTTHPSLPVMLSQTTSSSGKVRPRRTTGHQVRVRTTLGTVTGPWCPRTWNQGESGLREPLVRQAPATPLSCLPRCSGLGQNGSSSNSDCHFSFSSRHEVEKQILGQVPGDHSCGDRECPAAQVSDSCQPHPHHSSVLRAPHPVSLPSLPPAVPSSCPPWW